MPDIRYHLGAVCTRAGAFVLLLPLLLGTAGWAEEGERSFAKAGISFALGVRAFEDGESEEAARLFEDAVGYDPQHGDALHWLGLTYLRLGRPGEAVSTLEKSLDAQPTAGRRRVQSDLRLAREALEKKGSTSPVLVEPPAYEPEIPLIEELPRWEARAGLEALHDSNPGLLPEDLLLPLPGHPSLAGAISDEAANLSVQVEYHPLYSRGWNLGLAVAGQHSLYREQRDLDLSLLRGTVSLAWGASPVGSVSGPLGSTRVPTGGHDWLSFLLQGGGAQVWLGGDSYLGHGEGAFALIARESERTATRLEIEARDSSYSEDGPGALRRSGTEVTVGASQYLFLSRQGRHLRLGVAAGERQAGRAFDSSSGEALLELAAPLPARGSLRVLGSWREDRFDHPESSLASGRPERDDTTWRVIVASTWPLKEHLFGTLRASHVRRDSNVRIGLGSPLFDYERTTFSLGLSLRR